MEQSRDVIVNLAIVIFKLGIEFIPSESLIIDYQGVQTPFDTWLQDIRMKAFELTDELGVELKDDIPIRTLLQFLYSIVQLDSNLYDSDALQPYDNRLEDFYNLCDEHLLTNADVMQHFVLDIRVDFFDKLRTYLQTLVE